MDPQLQNDQEEERELDNPRKNVRILDEKLSAAKRNIEALENHAAKTMVVHADVVACLSLFLELLNTANAAERKLEKATMGLEAAHARLINELSKS